MRSSDGAFQHLFAPWRFTYVSNSTSSTCVFCSAVEGGRDTLTVLRGERAIVLLNRYPYTSGHTMVAPIAHVADLASLDPAALSEMMELTQRVVRALGAVYRPSGFNVGMNLGEAAGAGIADHLHLHVVPRWRGDTNFMTVSGGTRVIPEDLEDTFTKVQTALGGGA